MVDIYICYKLYNYLYKIRLCEGYFVIQVNIVFFDFFIVCFLERVFFFFLKNKNEK